MLAVKDPSALASRALVALVLLLPLALGGAYPPVDVAAAAVLLVLVAVCIAAGAPVRRQTHNPVLWALLVLIAATAVQLVPLPLSVLGVVSAKTGDLLQLSPGAPGSFSPLSLDPPATAQGLLMLVVCACAVWLLGVARSDDTRQRILDTITLAGTAVTFTGAAHAMAGINRTLGAFGPPRNSLVTTFINPNHASGFLGFCAFCAVAAAFDAPPRGRALRYLAAALCLAAALLTLARSAMFALIAAAAFVGLRLALSRSARLGALVGLHAVVAAGILVASYVGFSRMAHELWTVGDSGSFEKAALWRVVPPMILDFPVLGIGRGAFWSVSTHYLDDRRATFTHLENEILQSIVDWGPAVAVAAGLLFGLAYLRLSRAAASHPRDAALSGALLYIAVQNLADFNLQLSAVAVPVCLVLALPGEPGPTRRSRAPTTRRHGSDRAARRWSAVVAAVLAVLTGIGAVWALAHEPRRDVQRLRALLADPSLDVGARKRATLDLVWHHPADYLLPLLTATRELREPDGAAAAMPWVNRAMYLAPSDPDVHVAAGEALWRVGAEDQAVSELRAACHTHPPRTPQVAARLWRLSPRPAAVARLAGDSLAVRKHLAAFVLEHKAAHTALGLLDVDDASDDFEAQQLRAQAYVDVRRYAEAVAAAERMETLEPRRSEAYIWQKRAHVRAGEDDAALAALERGIARADLIDVLLYNQAEILIRRGEMTAARATANAILQHARSGAYGALGHSVLALIHERAGERTAALHELTRARERDPREIDYRLRIAALYTRLGNRDAARTELERARGDLGPQPAIDAALATLERGDGSGGEGP